MLDPQSEKTYKYLIRKWCMGRERGGKEEKDRETERVGEGGREGEREREREGGGGGERERERKGERKRGRGVLNCPFERYHFSCCRITMCFSFGEDDGSQIMFEHVLSVGLYSVLLPPFVRDCLNQGQC